MARTSTYLNFARNTEEAFNFYRSVFGNDFIGEISRFGDIPPAEDMPPLPEEDKNLIMHVALPILGGHVLMGTDAPESMGFKVNFGNNVYINLEPDTRQETKKLFDLLLDKHDQYIPVYYHAGKFYQESGEKERAMNLYEKGIVIAKKYNNSKAARELKSALDELAFE